MDTVGIEIPKARRRIDRTVAAAALTATAAAALAVGYAVGTSSDAAAPSVTVAARGAPATWDDALRESRAVKAHGLRVEQARAIDVRLRRVEE